MPLLPEITLSRLLTRRRRGGAILLGLVLCCLPLRAADGRAGEATAEPAPAATPQPADESSAPPAPADAAAPEAVEPGDPARFADPGLEEGATEPAAESPAADAPDPDAPTPDPPPAAAASDEADAEAAGPPPAPGMEAEQRAGRLERRGEAFSAQMAYAEAMKACAEAASRGEAADAEAVRLLWGRAEWNLEKVLHFANRTNRRQPAAAVIQAVKRLPELHPVLAARLRWAQADFALRAGEPQRARQHADRLGLLREWLLVGPFDNERGRSFDLELPPETWPLDPDAAYDGVKGEVRWRPVRTEAPLAFVDLDAFLRPHDEVLAYAACAVKVARAGRAALRLGSDDMIAAWVNGRPVHRFKGRRPAGFDQDVVPCRLRQGWNLLLLKAGDAKGPWGFYARLTEADGRPLETLAVSSDPRQIAEATAALGAEPPAVEEPGPDAPPLDRGALDAFRAALEHDPYDARMHYYVGWLLLARDQLAYEDHRDLQHLEQATKAGRGDPIHYLAFAEAAVDHTAHEADRDENPRRLALEKAIELGGDDEVEARVRLANYYLYAMQNLTRAAELARAAATANPLALGALLARYDIHRARGWDGLAGATVDRLVRRHARAAKVRLRAGSAALQQGAAAEALVHYRRLLEHDATHARAAEGLVESLLRLGRHGPLIDALKRLLAVRPYAPDLHRELVAAYLRTRNLPAALSAAESALAVAPDDAEMLERKGAILLRLERREEALAAWRRALALKPALLDLKRRLQLIEGETETLGTTIEDLRAYVQERADHPAQPAQGRLYLLNELATRLKPDGTRSDLVHQVVRLLDQDAVRDLSRLQLPYDADRSTLTVVTARVLRRDGRLESPTVSDQVSRRGTHYKEVRFGALSPGDVVEVAYRTDETRLGFFGDYYGRVFHFRQHFPTLTSRYVLETAPSRPVYIHRTDGAPAARVTQLAGGWTRRTWAMESLPAVEIEPYLPPLGDLSPSVQVSTFETWDELARWYWHLVREQYTITPEIERQVETLVVGQRTPLEKLDALYRWVTTEVQNVAWEFGVHGYKNYSVATVFQRRFGDCKDKAALLCVMARHLGLKAWPALLDAMEESGPQVGRGEEDLTLPLLSHFNHAICAVEVEGRLFWLDATVPYRTLQGVPSMDAGAESVIVLTDGARRETIPPQSAEDNLWQETTSLSVEPDGTGSLSQTVTARGEVAQFMRYYLVDRPHAARILEIVAGRRLGPVQVQRCAAAPAEALLDGSITAEARMRLARAARPDGETLRLRLPPAWLRSEEGPLPLELGAYAESSVRLYDLILPRPFAIESTWTVRLPVGYEPVNLPRPVEREHPFGRLSFAVERQGRSLTIRRILRLETNRIAQEDYPDFRRFCHQADAVDDYEYLLEPVK